MQGPQGVGDYGVLSCWRVASDARGFAEATGLCITYSAAGYEVSQAPSLEVIADGEARVINLPVAGKVNASRIYVPVNASFSVNLIVPPPKLVQGMYVIKYLITVDGRSEIQGITHIIHKCLGISGPNTN